MDGVDGTPTVSNPYHYADNDPLNKVDPLGLRASDADFDACASDPLIPSASELAGPVYSMHSMFGPAIERSMMVANCAKGLKAVRADPNNPNPYNRAPGNEGRECLKAVATGWVSLFACLTAFHFSDVALSLYGSEIDDVVGKYNAMRHFVWTALVAYDFGETEALRVTSLHEKFGESCPGTPRECQWDTWADEHNNTVGARYGYSIRGKYGTQFNCVVTWCPGYDEGALINDVVQAGYRKLAALELDTRGGCPSVHKVLARGC